MNENTNSALEWLAKAKRDLEAARRMIDCSDPLLDTGTYHCQQAAEKDLARARPFEVEMPAIFNHPQFTHLLAKPSDSLQ